MKAACSRQAAQIPTTAQATTDRQLHNVAVHLAGWFVASMTSAVPTAQCAGQPALVSVAVEVTSASREAIYDTPLAQGPVPSRSRQPQ